MNAPYALIPVVFLVLAAYFFSYLLATGKILGFNRHRYFWNLILLITFLVSGMLGLLAVVKVNYQLRIPHYEQLLRVHIHVGIGMVMVAFIHLFRHLKYYLSPKISNSAVEIDDSEDFSEIPAGSLLVSLFLLGFISFTAQLVLIREFLSVFSGNELVIGFFLSLWLTLTGTGAMSAKNTKPEQFSISRLSGMLILLSSLPMLILPALYWLKSELYPPGVETGPWVILSGIFLLLFPVCFLSGYLFVLFTGILSGQKNKNLIARAYAIESIGSLSGGILFSFLLVFFFRSFEILAITLVITSVATIIISGETGKSFLWKGITGISILVLAIIFIFRADSGIKNLFFTNQQIISNKSYPSGNSVATVQEGQLNFYENNHLNFYTNNIADIEESVHYAMVQAEKPGKVLIVSGDAYPMAREVLKYNPEAVDILMLNNQYYRLIENFVPEKLNSEKVSIFTGDPVRFLSEADSGKYHVVLMNTPPPSTLRDNRFYTIEFFDLVRQRSVSAAIISIQLPSTANYAGEEALGLNSSVYKTLKSAFKNVIYIPGEKNFYIASDAVLTLGIAGAVAGKNIPTKYVNRYYIDDEILGKRSNALLSTLDPNAPVNRILSPGAFLLLLRNWLRLHGTIYWIFAALPGLLLLIVLLRQTPVRAGLLISGFSASALQITLIVGYQLFFGNIFYQVSLFFVVFLAGLAGGTHLGGRYFKGINRFNLSLLGLSALSVALILIFLFLKQELHHFAVIFHILNGTSGLILGFIFSQAASLERQSISQRTSLNYSADLIGSALGTYLASVFFIPVVGIIPSCIIFGSAPLAGFIYILIQRKKDN